MTVAADSRDDWSNDAFHGLIAGESTPYVISQRHNEGSNVLFGDGHCAGMKYTAIPESTDDYFWGKNSDD